MKTNSLLIISLSIVLFAGCTHRSEQQSTNVVDTPEVLPWKPIVDTVPVFAEEIEPSALAASEATKIEESKEPTNRRTSYPSESYDDYSSNEDYSSSYSNDSDDDYWEEVRKTSPNDNYLLGFDEDVDDVHDMELYMEDY